MNKVNWDALSLFATVGGVIVAWHGYQSSRGWTDAHRFFVGLSIVVAIGPQLRDL